MCSVQFAVCIVQCEHLESETIRGDSVSSGFSRFFLKLVLLSQLKKRFNGLLFEGFFLDH